MKRTNLRECLLIKVGPLMDIARCKIRHKTEEEERRYINRQKKAQQYIGELVSCKTVLDEVGDMGNIVSESFIEDMKKMEPHLLEQLFKGDYVKIFRFKDHIYMTLAPVKDIKSFK